MDPSKTNPNNWGYDPVTRAGGQKCMAYELHSNSVNDYDCKGRDLSNAQYLCDKYKGQLFI